MALIDVPTSNPASTYPILQTESPLHNKTNQGGESISLKELERELPVVDDGQIALSDLLSRIAQSVYAEMTEIAET
jgi:mediator of RNA polymerase II transcription subunit 14